MNPGAIDGLMVIAIRYLQSLDQEGMGYGAAHYGLGLAMGEEP
jgi:hypothetical protein